MKVKDRSKENKYSVSDIWEVRLEKSTILRLRKIAGLRRTTMSWLARYCIFRLIHKKKIHHEKFHDMVDEIRANSPPFRETGRFYICFYGEDILWVKMQSGILNVTVSMLVRVALERYLSSLENEARVPYWRLFWYGLKCNQSVQIERHRRHRSFVQEFLNSKSYNLSDYWKIPQGHLPSFLFLQT